MKNLSLVIILCFSFLKTNAFISKRSDIIQNIKVEKLSNCIAKLDDGSIIDLSSLDNPSDPLSTLDDTKKFEFEYNPCSPIVCDPNSLKTSAVCQKQLNSHLEYNCGDQSTAAFSFQDSLIITYKSASRTSIVICECSDDQKLDYLSEGPKQKYQLKLSSPCCCPDKCSGKKPSKGGNGLSLGSILMIIFFSILIVYIAGGFIFLKFVQKKSGTEAIPNYEFWASVPGDFKAGVSFTVSKFRGQQNSYSQI
ncbi:unnamed protein product [Brachionus calyciflorus]|uniref:Autophagy-related protein 27 n=1 Tax=Brachionus calyciflorus TaxID=104777 RepID=A0A813Y628_9BILA|nr:unnamed protein product [Brachionus calyciflorus]